MSHRYNTYCAKCCNGICEYDEEGKKISQEEYRIRSEKITVDEIIREGLDGDRQP